MPYSQKNREEYAYAGQADRGVNLMLAAKAGHSQFGLLMFSYCVAAYKAHPSKRRAIWIWMRFLEKSFGDDIGCDYMRDPGEIDLTVDLASESDIRFAWNRVRNEIMLADRMRLDANKMSLMARVQSSGSRNMSPTLFDELLDMCVNRGAGINQAWADLANRIHENEICSETMYGVLRTACPGLVRELTNNKFDLNAVGLPAAMRLM